MAEFFHLLGTRSNPLNIFRVRDLTLALSRNSCGDGVANGIFPHIYQGLERAEAALTFRQGDFAEDPSEEGKQAQTAGRN